jgi:thiol-disulfide isomerase/thioredoxin
MKYILLAVGAAVMSVAARGEVPPATSSTPPSNSAPVSPAAAASTPAGKAWAQLTEDFSTLRHAQSDEALMEKTVISLYAEAKDFAAKYPDDTNTLNAISLEAQLGQAMIAKQWPGAPTGEEIDKLFEKLASSDKIPKQQRASIRAMQIVNAMHMADKAPDNASGWDSIDARIDGFQKEFGADVSLDGKHAVLVMLRANELTALKNSGQTARYDALVQKLSTDTTPEMADMAKELSAEQKRMSDLKSKPLDLTYTAADGSTVDLAKMRGKVVMIDFWATWCGPCVEEVPNVVAAYQKYHDKGFEIVGVSLDQDKDAMQTFTKSHGMTWPQYFDGKVWKNDISTRFGIDSIPAMWLIDKKGMLVTMNGRDDLAGQVEKLLNAP